MGLLRSEAMKYGTLMMPGSVQEARNYIDAVGKRANLQFEDMNSRDMRRPYRKHVQRIDEMERILRFLFDEIGRIPGLEISKNHIDDFLESDGTYKLDGMETELRQLYTQFMKFKENNDKLTVEYNTAMEEFQVVEAASRILGVPFKAEVLEETFMDSARKPLVGEDLLEKRLGYISGVVPKVDEARFARAVWRASRGNTFTQFQGIDSATVDPKTGLIVAKSVFLIGIIGGVTSSMHQKILKVCQAFSVNMYNWPSDSSEAKQRSVALQSTLKDKDAALCAFKNFMQIEASDLVRPMRSGNSKIEEWRMFCVKEKSIYTVLNMCAGEVLLRVNVWYPADEEGQIQALLAECSRGASVGARLLPDRSGGAGHSPPTYVRVNDFTEGWQEVINTYGIPRYQEANPALLAVVTFPFIFGMMYGDIGHGALLLIFGMWCCANSDSLKFSQPTLHFARYMILQLGIFAVFAGFLYNDFFSISLQLFPSSFEDPDGDGNWTPKPGYDLKNSGAGTVGTYPFGLDWAWAGAQNELLFVNSLKMKLSVLMGVVQMTVGLLLRWSNAFYEKNMVDFIFECIPMMIFMLCFFGWMDFMIMYKWVHPIDSPPSIINSLICMTMGQEDKNPLWDGSLAVAGKLMIATAAAVPVMLFPKPFIMLYQHKKKKEAGNHGTKMLEDEEMGDAQDTNGGHGGHGEEFEFGEVFIHQIIETIEFVLGTVSHTASYLRIWALSLAHQQLSMVFFQKTLQMGLEFEGSPVAKGIFLYFMFAAWFGVTLGVLLGMDVLECFLHTLRLHWVEFQSKFYRADGYKFEPYSVRALLASE